MNSVVPWAARSCTYSGSDSDDACVFFELKCQTLLCRHEDFEEELLLNLRVLAMLYGDIAATIDLWVTAAAMGPAQQGNV